MSDKKMVDKVEYHTQCLISGSTNLVPLKGYEKDYLVKSRSVGFVFCSRIPTPEELIQHYEKYPRNDYLSPITVRRYHELLDEFEAYNKTGKILDIGCGTGLFLIEAKKRGWEVYGTEYTDTAINICKLSAINMQQGKLDPAWYQENMFDVITSFEVIEHINNPKEDIENIKKILRPNGLFYFTTPNFNAVERYLLKGSYNIIEYPEHLSYYTKKTVHYLLTNAGFKRKKLTTTGLSITRIRTSLGKKEALINASSTDELVRQRLEKKALMQMLKKALNGILNVIGIGSSLKGWYINKKNEGNYFSRR
jgi:2-polyprenyl-3-methyl-5-hydroxy-6-metoxy-1,4-benzoquinol methylase